MIEDRRHNPSYSPVFGTSKASNNAVSIPLKEVTSSINNVSALF